MLWVLAMAWLTPIIDLLPKAFTRLAQVMVNQNADSAEQEPETGPHTNRSMINSHHGGLHTASSPAIYYLFTTDLRANPMANLQSIELTPFFHKCFNPHMPRRAG